MQLLKHNDTSVNLSALKQNKAVKTLRGRSSNLDPRKPDK